MGYRKRPGSTGTLYFIVVMAYWYRLEPQTGIAKDWGMLRADGERQREGERRYIRMNP